MNKCINLAGLIAVVLMAFGAEGARAQTNIFPVDGKVGIGTTNPGSELHVWDSNTSRPGGVSSPSDSVFRLSRSGTYNYSYDEGAEFRIGHGGSYVYGSQLDLYINGGGNTNGIPDQQVMTWLYNGNVGIGTTSPQVPLHVLGGTQGSYNLISWDQGVAVNTGTSYMAHRMTAFGGPYGYGGEIAGFLTQGVGAGLTLSTVNNAAPVEIMRLNYDGNVGIGTPNPHRKLHIAGDVQIDGNLFFGSNPQAQGEAYAGVKCGGDYAESMDVTGDRAAYAPGDVLVLDTDNPGRVLKSIEPYSTTVAGIYSTKPGTIGRRQITAKSDSEVPMAMVGVVPTKVTAENGLINVGDLLVSSSMPGYAMKGTDRSRMLGAVIGKAMGRLNAGTGTIEVLVALQ